MVNRSHGKGLWKGILACREDFWKGVRFKVGRGNKVSFWKDKWCGEETLRDRFPQLYCMSVSREASVSDFLALGEGGLFWDIQM